MRKPQQACKQDRLAAMLCSRHFVNTCGCGIEKSRYAWEKGPVEGASSAHFRPDTLHSNRSPRADYAKAGELHFEISDQDAQGGILQGRRRYTGLSAWSKLSSCNSDDASRGVRNIAERYTSLLQPRVVFETRAYANETCQGSAAADTRPGTSPKMQLMPWTTWGQTSKATVISTDSKYFCIRAARHLSAPGEPMQPVSIIANASEYPLLNSGGPPVCGWLLAPDGLASVGWPRLPMRSRRKKTRRHMQNSSVTVHPARARQNDTHKSWEDAHEHVRVWEATALQ